MPDYLCPKDKSYTLVKTNDKDKFADLGCLNCPFITKTCSGPIKVKTLKR